jgi:hypothetical protein
MIIIVLLYFVLSLIAKFLLGCTIVRRMIGRGDVDFFAISFILGAVVHLLGVLLLKSLHLPWVVAVAMAALPGLLSIGELKKLGTGWRVVVSKEYLLWLVVVAALGCTIIKVDGGIGSLWENNGSDLAFHLGIISSFTLGDNFPPQYTIFPGETLSYSFLINLWTAEWWWIEPSYSKLPLIFWSQWFVLWALIPKLLLPSRIAPWLLLFGGGSIFNFLYTSQELIGKNLPWSVFISTIWVPQRSAMFGIAVILSALRLYICGDKKERGFLDGRFVLSGLLLGLSILVHAHLVATCAMFIVILQAVKVVEEWRAHSGINELGGFLSFCFGLVSAFFTLPLLAGKEGMVGPMAGWVTGEVVMETASMRIFPASFMWLESIPQILALVLLIFFQNKFRKELFVITAMFLVGNFIRLSVWPWDQIKLFLGLYVILVFLLSLSIFRLRFLNVIIVSLLVSPAIWESAREIIKGGWSLIYSPSHIDAAMQLNKLLPKRAIVVADSSAFSVVTLAGRFLYKGYDGTLWSHGIKKASIVSRAHFQSDLGALGKCMYREKQMAICPGFLLWSGDEQILWNLAIPPEEWQTTDLPWIYSSQNITKNNDLG